MNKIARLEDLFSSLYAEPDDIKAFMRRCDKTRRAVAQIRWARTLDLVASDVVDWLRRQGLIDKTLFERLRAVHGSRDDEIRDVASVWGCPLPPAPGAQEVLFVAAVGRYAVPLTHVEVELRAIRGAWGSDRVRDLPAARRWDLFRHVLNHPPTVIHFAGHGSGEGLFLLDEDNEASELPASVLSEMMKVAREGERPWLLVLNACESVRVAEVCAGAGCWAIGLDGLVDDESAGVFAAELHGALAGADDPRSALPGAFERAVSAAAKSGRAPYRLFPSGRARHGT